MPTDEQRREVAEILHACADTYNEAEQCLQRYGLSLHKIADLIEPSERTCHPVTTVDGLTCGCSNCGADLRVRLKETVINYCSHCGARVIHE